MRSLCYSVTIIRSNIAKTAFKLEEFLINLELEHLHAVNHYIQYLHNIKFLIIRYVFLESEELTVFIDKDKHVFEVAVDASFANEKDRKSAKDYAFKLFDELID